MLFSSLVSSFRWFIYFTDVYSGLLVPRILDRKSSILEEIDTKYLSSQRPRWLSSRRFKRSTRTLVSPSKTNIRISVSGVKLQGEINAVFFCLYGFCQVFAK